MKLKDKVVILTGAARGIGAATARLFTAQGAFVVLMDKTEDLLKELSTELNRDQKTSSFYALDITDSEAVKQAVADIAAKHTKIDILINNAGITRDSLLGKMSEEAFDTVIDVNLKAPFMLTREAFPYMKEQKSGVILNAASVSSLGNVGQSNYAASKAGIIAMTKTWALEFARYNIRVNAIAPGFTDTELVKAVPDEIKAKIIEKVPLRRLAQPEEIASSYSFLASDEAAFITGQVLFIDGGLTCGF